MEGILSYQGGETYQNIIQLFSELGYHTEGRKLMANHYGVPQQRKRVIILCTRKDLNIIPSDIFPKPITTNIEKQSTAYETIFDLEQVLCGENVKYTSNYSSNILNFLKGKIDAKSYIEKAAGSKEVLSSAYVEMDEEIIGITDSDKENNNYQMTLFDFM